jgi:signal transduction histidine kinase
MNSSSATKHKSNLLARGYRAALRRYTVQGSAASLNPAMRLGHQAVVLGLETLDLALIHEEALIVQTLPIHSSVVRDRIIRRAGTFFAEAILPLEETHRSAMEANVELSRLNQALSRRSVDLVSSNRRLKREIARRRVVEKNLRQSKHHSIQLLGQSRRMQEQLRLLSRGILSAQEEERKRISRELHDVIGQILTSINVRLAVLKTEATVNTKGLTKSIAHTQRLLEKSVNVVRRFAYNLRPSLLDDLGLVPCLESFLTRFMKETGVRMSLMAFAGLERLSSVKRTTLYRVVQEALTNITRHAQASRGEVIVKRLANDVHMQIKDNGRSFDVERVLRSKRSRHLGLLGMRERVEMVGGKFAVESAPGKGTTINVQIPFNNSAKEHRHP